MYVCTAELGLFAERITESPFRAEEDEEPGEQCPADQAFRARPAQGGADRQVGLLEEHYVHTPARWDIAHDAQRLAAAEERFSRRVERRGRRVRSRAAAR
ncbi:hypothetical protein [Streptomyces sp. NPDC096339]|uniref:hypothetical protein n=1 Tax=Streptomyces sp. NPDC096339 TaxID=3366086 RepID=UPI00381BD1B1